MSAVEDDQPFIPAKTKKISALVRNAIKVQEQALAKEAELARKAQEREDDQSDDQSEDEQPSVPAPVPVKTAPVSAPSSGKAKTKPSSTPDTKRGNSTGPGPLLSTTSSIPTGRTCPGCYHCNWTGVSGDNYGCALTYYGSQQ